MNDKSPHYPVMLPEILDTLSPKDGETYIDGTLGAGGYSRAILDSSKCNLIGIDRDKTAIEMSREWSAPYGDRLNILNGCFGDVEKLLESNGIGKVDGFVLDLGVSSMQLDQAERGFSFKRDGPLDMRMGVNALMSAEDLVNEMEQDDLANVIYQYGEERHSRRVAKAIVDARQEERIKTTLQLANIVRSVIHKNPKSKIDSATKTFQALRIKVNDELGEVERALASSINILKENGRLVVVSFHSLEDRIVKNFLKEQSGNKPSPSRHMPVHDSASQKPLFRLISKKPINASEKELSENSRSRSAHLRYGIRLEDD